MTAPRFTGIQLSYGCHDARFDFPHLERPVVIAGPNGSGKSTLIEAIVRTLYGFRRQSPEEREVLDCRQPWAGGALEALVELQTAVGEQLTIRRDFANDDVVVSDSEGKVLFRGDANPGSGGRTYQDYRSRLQGWIGFGTLGPYRRTAWIAQGELVRTALSDELLRITGGGHRRVESARQGLLESYHELTREPIAPGATAKRSDRELEELRFQQEEVDRQLEEAHRATAERLPLLEQKGHAAARLTELEQRIELLEQALEPLAQKRAVSAEKREAEGELERWEQTERELNEAARRLDRANDSWEAVAAGPLYPEDFDERARELELVWEQDAGLERLLRELDAPDGVPPSRLSISLLAGGLAMLGASLVALASGVRAVGITGAAVGLGMGAAAWVWWRWRTSRMGTRLEGRFREVEFERARLASRVEAALADMPRADDIHAGTLEEHRQRFARQVDIQTRREAARRGLAETILRLERRLGPGTGGDADEGNATASQAAGTVAAALGELESREARLRERLAEDASGARRRVAGREHQLEEQTKVGQRLPDGVAPDVAAVEAALRQHRTEREALRTEFGRLDRELGDVERRAEEEISLEERQAALRKRIAHIEADVRAHRHAWELIGDAYREFRDQDQERLASAISARLVAVSGGTLGPLEVTDALDAASVRVDRRSVNLESPPLSFAEKHLALFAIRLGTADFLAEESVHHPLLVDEPFTHLDEVRAQEVWRLLRVLAADRQVLVATQDRLVLDYLGIEPDIVLEGRGRTRGRSPTATESAPEVETPASAATAADEGAGGAAESVEQNGGERQGPAAADPQTPASQEAGPRATGKASATKRDRGASGEESGTGPDGGADAPEEEVPAPAAGDASDSSSEGQPAVES